MLCLFVAAIKEATVEGVKQVLFRQAVMLYCSLISTSSICFLCHAGMHVELLKVTFLAGVAFLALDLTATPFGLAAAFFLGAAFLAAAGAEASPSAEGAAVLAAFGLAAAFFLVAVVFLAAGLALVAVAFLGACKQ